jgi:hypothetical protein
MVARSNPEHMVLGQSAEAIWICWFVASGAAKASSLAPSALRAAASFLDSRSRVLTISAAVLLSRLIFQVARTKPSTSPVPTDLPLLVASRRR